MIVIGILVGLLVASNVTFAFLIWREIRRRSPGQIVAASSGRQPDASLAAAALPTAKPIDDEAWLKEERNRVIVRLGQQFPGIGQTKREAIADELIRKGRSMLARVR